jgi:aryl-alcohol dehydrogenase-like predicted oxidoreductase
MDRIRLGEVEVSRQGLGCMGMSEWYGPADWDTSIATISRAIELGATFLDTADVYGAGHNEVLVGRAARAGAAGDQVRHRSFRR